MKVSLKTPIKSIGRNPVYSLFLFIPIVIISFMFFAGMIIDTSLSRGMINMEKRLGSDLIIVPSGAKDDATNILLEGARGTFYFDRSVYETITSVDGVGEVSAQFFLKSLSADCCSSEVEIVFFDPDTDLIVAPWINKEYNSELDASSVIVGNSVKVEDDGTIKLFGVEYKVAAKMAKTGTSLDTSVYFTFAALESVIKTAVESGAFLTDYQKSTELVSSIYINIADGYTESMVLENIKSVISEDFDVIYPKQLMKTLSSNIEGVYTIIHSMVIASGVLLFIILIIVNTIIVNDRKREIALFRIYGVSKRQILKVINSGSVLLSAAGAISGCLLGSLFIIPFGDYIGYKLDMAYLGPDLAVIFAYYVIIIAGIVIIEFITSIFPLIYVCNLAPYTALRREGE